MSNRPGLSRINRFSLACRLAATLWLTLAALLLANPAQAEERAGKLVRIGVLAKLGSENTLAHWQPTADYLSDHLPDYRFEVVALGFDELNQVVARGEVDFVFANPSFYVELERRYGVSRILTLNNRCLLGGCTAFGGVIFTRNDNNQIQRLEDLRGKRFAAVKHSSLGGFQAAWLELRDYGLSPHEDMELSFRDNHLNVVHAVLKGLADAGTVRTDTLERMAAEGAIDLDQIRVLNRRMELGFDYLLSTRLYPEWPLARLNHTPTALTKQVASVLLAMPTDAPAAELGHYVGWSVPSNYQSVHELLKTLQIGPYHQYGEIGLLDALYEYWYYVLGALVLLLLLVWVAIGVNEKNIRLRMTSRKLRIMQSQLEDRVSARTHELRYALDELDSNNRRLRLILDSAEEGIFGVDIRGVVTFVNRSAARMLGYGEDELVGKPAHERIHHTKQDGTAYPHSQCSMLSPIQSGKACRVTDDLLWRKDGSSFPVEYHSAPISRDDEIYGAVITFVDVTERRKFERAIEQERNLFVAGPTVVFKWRAEEGWPIEYVSPNIIGQLGYHPDDLQTGKAGYLDFVHPDDLPRLKREAEESSRSGQPHFEQEYRIADVGGEYHWVYDNTVIVRNEAGEITHYHGYINDITEKKLAEEALRNSERLIRAVQDAAMDCIVTFDHEGHIIQFNPAAERTFGFMQWEVLGRDVFETVIPEGRREEYREAFATHMLAGNDRLINRRFDTQAMRRNGEIFPAELAVSRIEVEGKPLFTAYLRDITQRKAAEALIRKNEERLKKAQQIAKLGTWEWDLTQQVMYWSEELYRLFGFTPGSLKPEYNSLVNSVHPDDCEQFEDAIEQAKETGKPFKIDHRIITLDGTVRYVHEEGTVSVSANGRPVMLVGTMQDVTEQKQVEEALRLAATAFETHEAIMVTDREGKILQVNESFTEITGYRAEEVLGKNPRIIASGRHDHEFYQTMWSALLRDGYWQGEIWNQRKSGEVYPEWLTITAVKSEEGGPSHFVAHFQDITERKRAEEKIRHQAFYDELTQLPNRRLLYDRLEQELSRSKRKDYVGCVLFIDLDNFKTINDSLGHGVGDELIKQVALRLKANLRDEDTVARLGGDEFIVLVPELAEDEETAVTESQIVAAKIKEAIAEPYHVSGHEFHITTSIGLTLFPEESLGADDILRQADSAMYRAKENGRNAYQFYLPSMQVAADERLMLEHDLRRAIQQKQLELYYQAQMQASGQVVGAECLLRWKHHQHGFISPASFIPIAEETGVILDLGEWILNEACRQLAEWSEQGLSGDLLKLAVNVSPRQFHQHNFVEQVKHAVAQWGVEPKRLELELTEGILIANIKETVEKMRSLREFGISFAIDDFGTGYSSLTYLKRLPVNKLKIDRTFIRDITYDQNDAAIVDTIIAMARHLGLSVITEGVETEEQLAFLRDRGCEMYQGYYFHRPAPAEEFARLLAASSAKRAASASK